MDFVANVSVWDFDIVFCVAIVRHQRQEAILGNIELVAVSGDAPYFGAT